MGDRGKKSSAAASVVPIQGGKSIARPIAPPDLTDVQAEEWDRIIGSLPADWFPPETHNLLSQYCRHSIAARNIGQLISNMEGLEAIEIDEYDKLLKMQEREGRAMSSLATRMRMTQQATYHPEKTKGKGRMRLKPNEFDG